MKHEDAHCRLERHCRDEHQDRARPALVERAQWGPARCTERWRGIGHAALEVELVAQQPGLRLVEERQHLGHGGDPPVQPAQVRLLQLEIGAGQVQPVAKASEFLIQAA